ncbi:thioesterase family protein [Nocardiopsis salina]|uniref:thioesterase family protein n=1 Tax=Nocardiopsis salina TaxID=245836 RepID=UPI00034BE686|nr:thioesterase family protein [Nocardiopsis salina]
MDVFYERTGPAEFSPTPATAGPWSPHHQHAGPPSALLAGALEDLLPGPDHRLARMTVDVLGPVPLEPLSIEASEIRPGRSVGLLEAHAYAGGRAVLTARAWRMRTTPRGLPARPEATPAPPEIPAERQSIEMPGAHTGGYLSVVEWRTTEGSVGGLGPSRSWGRSTIPLLVGEQMSPWQRTVLLADSASGISLTLDPLRYPAINCDLHVVLHRDPATEWLLVDAETTTAPEGGALTSTALGDVEGPVGTATQSLFAQALG